MFGWRRSTIETGLGENRTGILCVGSQSIVSGRKTWEELNPDAAEALRLLAEYHAQQDPDFDTSVAFTRLTSKEALKQIKTQGFEDEQLPALATVPNILDRMGYRLRKVVKVKPQKKFRRQTPSSTT